MEQLTRERETVRQTERVAFGEKTPFGRDDDLGLKGGNNSWV